jgi:hypothetical protein
LGIVQGIGLKSFHESFWLELFMTDTSAIISGELEDWPSKQHMAAILCNAGLKIYVGRYSLRVDDCDRFIFQGYGGDLGKPCIDADADSVEALLRDGRLVSDALGQAGIRHRFEIYDRHSEMVGYLHHDWPLEENK